jgi:hypothetical protein
MNNEALAQAAPGEPIMQYFEFAHLPIGLQAISAPFGNLAQMIVDKLPRSAERSVALRKLLEAKDAAVRANLPLKLSPAGVETKSALIEGVEGLPETVETDFVASSLDQPDEDRSTDGIAAEIEAATRKLD